jgi:hypothetical protein
MRDAWSEILVDSFRDMAQRLGAVAPRLLAALTLVLLGWAVATLARRLTARVLAAGDLDARCARWGLSATLARTGVRRSPSELVARVVFWILLVVALLMAVEALEVPATTGLAAAAVRFLPNLVVAALVLLVGWLLAQFLAQAVLIFVVNAQLAGGALAAAAVRWLVLVFAGGVALTQLDIAREMVLIVFGIAFGGTVLALALAFGLGGRDLAREALESWLRRPERDQSDRLTHV